MTHCSVWRAVSAVALLFCGARMGDQDGCGPICEDRRPYQSALSWSCAAFVQSV
jgi:hypothetical protein